MNNTTFPRFPKIYLIIFLVALISACATYFQTQYKFHEKFMQGQLESAVSILDKDKKIIAKPEHFEDVKAYFEN